MQFSIRAVELVDNDRKEVIIERARELIPMLAYRQFGLNERLSRAYYLYQRKYNEKLNIRELTILCLYIIFPDDKKFINMLENYNYNFEYVAKLYSINNIIIKLRYDSFMSLNNKTLELK